MLFNTFDYLCVGALCLLATYILIFQNFCRFCVAIYDMWRVKMRYASVNVYCVCMHILMYECLYMYVCILSLYVYEDT